MSQLGELIAIVILQILQKLNLGNRDGAITAAVKLLQAKSVDDKKKVVQDLGDSWK